MVLNLNWKYFFTQLVEDLENNNALLQLQFKTQAELYKQEVHYRDLSIDSVHCNKIKRSLHEIFCNAIFEYSPCKELIHKTYKPIDSNAWRNPPPLPRNPDRNLWFALGTEPYHLVCYIVLMYLRTISI